MGGGWVEKGRGGRGAGREGGGEGGGRGGRRPNLHRDTLE